MDKPRYAPDINLICDLGQGMVRSIEGEMHRTMFVETLLISLATEIKRLRGGTDGDATEGEKRAEG